MKCYIITGASRGLGEAMALELLKEEAELYCISRGKSEKLTSMENITFLQADLTDESTLQPLMDKVFSGLDFKRFESMTLINNAGMVEPVRPAGRLKPDEIQQNISINLTAPLILSSLFIEKTERFPGKKRILNISSGAARHPYGSWSIYCSSKSGLDMFSRAAAAEQEGLENPVKIISLAPGIVDTDMQALIRTVDEKDFSLVGKFIDYKREGQLQSPEAAASKIVKYLRGEMEKSENGSLLDIRNLD